MTGFQKIAAGALLLICGYFLFFAGAGAQEFTSTDFKVLDPVVQPGGYSSSASYKLTGVITQIATGISTGGSFEVQGGFLYFPEPSTAAAPAPVVSEGGGNVGGGGPILDIFKKILSKIIALITPCSNGDLNCDSHVDVSDAGILFYWWDKEITRPEFADILTSFLGRKRSSPDFNKDSQVNIFDLSILLTHWTG